MAREDPEGFCHLLQDAWMTELGQWQEAPLQVSLSSEACRGLTKHSGVDLHGFECIALGLLSKVLHSTHRPSNCIWLYSMCIMFHMALDSPWNPMQSMLCSMQYPAHRAS